MMMAILIERKRRRRRRKETILEALQHHYQQQKNEQQDEMSMRCAMSRKSLSFLLFVSFAFTLISISPIQLANANPQQQSQQQQQQQQQQTLAPTSSFGGQSVIMAPQQVTTTSGKARYKTLYACEDRQLTIDCDFGSKINLIRANFGRFSITQCNEQGQLDLSTDCMSPITFRIMRERCADKQKCSVNATSAIFGDKCPKTRKYLEVHFQCLAEARSSPAGGSEPEERVDLRNNGLANQPSHILYPPINSGASSVLPPNNPAPAAKSPSESVQPARVQAHANQANQHTHLPALMTVMNSEILSFGALTSANNEPTSKLSDPIEVVLRHKLVENMSNPRCVLWDQSANQWTERGARVIVSNLTHTVCQFDQASSYLLVMDYSAAAPSSGAQSSHAPDSASGNPNAAPASQQANTLVPLAGQLLGHSSAPQPIGQPFPGILEQQPVVLDALAHRNQQSGEQQQQQPANSAGPSSLVRFFSLFGYLLAFVFVAVAFMTIAFIASTMRPSAGAALKSLGNFSAFSSPKYKGRRADGSLHNKDLLVINNQNGHQCLYSPAQSTKITGSASSHILASQHQNALHQLQQQQQQQQQQQMYSANGTLSNLSNAGGQSNNYYYGLMGFTHLFQQQQQQQMQQHLSQQQQQQQASYQHQANKSTVSSESANSTPSSSGIESGSTSVQQQQQQQQACLMLNNDYNLMGHMNNYGQLQPTLTLNAHYAPAAALLPASQQQLQSQQRAALNGLNGSMREHIYESVDDDKPYAARLLLAPNAQLFHDHHQAQHPHQQFGANTFKLANQQANQANQSARAMTLSTRLLQEAMQQQPSQVQTQLAGANKRLFSQPAIVRDNQAKTNIVCSKLVQVTPQRATEVNKFQHEVMAIYNANDQTTTTTNSSSANSSTCYGRADNLGATANKLSTDC